ncbi:Flagellar basal body-associated FliL family domain protein [Candidatus Bealeia paramacronuclearis]|uniref:Flagellar basal body-associated FliL family domain protein n=1 Tax=Candidatus Bealeia paramacronuclearis TaxID=1921001 RepID=A0ABZ2C316_9PROT|nr:Flagellar basal body-associated FliL family domain protein [Candidatus Bealeia paramacronuclearis]
MLKNWILFFILIFSTVPVYAADPPTLPNRGSRGSHDDPPHNNVTPDHFVHLKPFDIPVLQEDSVKGYVGVTVTLEAHTPEEANKIKDVMPRVRSEILVDIYSIMYLLWHPDFMPDIEMIKSYIQKSTDKILEGDLVSAIYTKDFYVRKEPVP